MTSPQGLKLPSSRNHNHNELNCQDEVLNLKDLLWKQ